MRGSLCPLDGRYAETVAPITKIFSERALVRNRIEIELKYLTALATTLFGDDYSYLRVVFEKYYNDDSLVDKIFEMEKTTRHDVKAVEMVLQTFFIGGELDGFIPLIHFGLTSQDVNSVAVWMQVRSARDIATTGFNRIAEKLHLEVAQPNKDVIMLARTHGQPATPTTMGKEMMVFSERLWTANLEVARVVARTKFGGATGGFNAHRLAYPFIDWPRWSDDFLMKDFRMERQQHTTQIEHYDGMAQLFDAVKRCNTILIDFCRDMWQYISMGYFKQTKALGAIGSSTMPHKTNPIHFENAEGNLMLANALLEFMASKLPVSRLQRDLTDSTVTRNIGMAFGYTHLAIEKVLEGLTTITVDEERIRDDLASNYAVVTEGIQTILRAAGVKDAYELVKELTANGILSHESVVDFASELNGQGKIGFEEAVKIMELTPESYEPMISGKFTTDTMKN